MSRECIVHKAVELDKVQKKLRPTPDELTHNYICQLKYDGCNMVAMKAGQSAEMVALLSRTGETVHSANELREHIGGAPFMPLGVYLGEYWHPEFDIGEISGRFRKQSEQFTGMHFVVCDYLTIAEWDQGYSDLTYVERVNRLPELFFQIDPKRSLVYPAHSEGNLIDEKLTPDEAAALVAASGNYDGIILRKPDGKWKVGRGTGGEIIKFKPTLTLDLRVLNYITDTGEKTGRKVFTIVVQLPNGMTQEVGSGIPHQESRVPEKGDIVEIEAMGYSKHGQLREPRFKCIRHDKTTADGE